MTRASWTTTLTITMTYSRLTKRCLKDILKKLSKQARLLENQLEPEAKTVKKRNLQSLTNQNQINIGNLEKSTEELQKDTLFQSDVSSPENADVVLYTRWIYEIWAIQRKYKL